MADEMYVGQIPVGTRITINTTTNSGSVVSLNTEALEAGKELGALYVKPLQNKEGKYYSFKGLKVKAQVVIDNRIYFFPLEEMPIVAHKGKHVHAIVCKSIQKPTNRREDVRVKLSSRADFAPVNVKISAETYVFDVSRSGIGINAKGEHHIETNEEVIIGFTYRVGRETQTYKVATRVVHCRYNKENGVTKIGCQFLKSYPKIDELVTYIQREELKKLTHDREA